MVKVSVVTAVYNRSSTVGQAVQSVQSQTYPLVEHVIQDGGSTDGTLQVIARLSNTGSSVLSERDHGIYDAIKVASTDEVIVFRTIDGQRQGAIFDINRIRKGIDPDPQILGNDIVVVGFNSVKGAYRDFISLGPVLNVFRGW